jgi:hypothetical protein
VLQKCGWLSSYADSSSGWLSDTVFRAQEVIRNVCKIVPKDSEDKEYIFTHGLKDSQHKDFDGWDDYPYSLLRSIAMLVTEKTLDKFYAVLDAFTQKIVDKNSEYEFGRDRHIESDRLVRYELILATQGENAADSYVNENLKFDKFRELAIQNSLTKSDFALAEKLCLDRVVTHKYHEKPYTSPSKWDYLLYEVYEKKGDIKKQIETSERILFLYDIEYFDVLKKLLSEKGVWGAEYPSLRERLKNDLPYEKYMEILSREGDTVHLFEQVGIHPKFIFLYGKLLSLYYTDEVREICLDEIRRQTAEASTRGQYKKVCGNIKKLAEYSEFDDAYAVIAELKKAYPRRPALLEELDSLVIKLEKAERKKKG